MARTAPETRVAVAAHRAAFVAGLGFALIAALAGPAPVGAADLGPGEALARPELAAPRAEAEASVRQPVLPPLALPDDGAASATGLGLAIAVERFAFEGNAALADAELEAIAQPYTRAAREARGLPGTIGYGELQALRDALTLAYVDRGYVTSGATIPARPYSAADGVFRFALVEGRLAAVRVQTEGRLAEGYARRRLRAPDSDATVEVGGIEARLFALQSDPRVESVQARLVPGAALGESELVVRVLERDPLSLWVAADNRVAPAIGQWGGELGLQHLNLNGSGDVLRARFRMTEGLRAVDAEYAVPIPWTPIDALSGPLEPWLRVYARYSESEVVAGLFSDERSGEPGDPVLDIESRSETYGLELEQPLFASRRFDLRTALVSEWRRSRSFLFGDGFSFSAGPEEGEARIAALRWRVDATLRDPNWAVAVRSTVSGGLPYRGVTLNRGAARDGEVPDARFASWLLQIGGSARLPWAGLRLDHRSALQLASDPLLGLEQFAIGGHATVRGYRENELVRDQGFTSTVELHWPFWQAPPRPVASLRGGDEGWRRALRAFVPRSAELVPFVDFGVAFTRERTQPASDRLLSVGLGAVVVFDHGVTAQLFWGEALRNDFAIPGDGAQGDGLHFRLEARWN